MGSRSSTAPVSIANSRSDAGYLFSFAWNASASPYQGEAIGTSGQEAGRSCAGDQGDLSVKIHVEIFEGTPTSARLS